MLQDTSTHLFVNHPNDTVLEEGFLRRNPEVRYDSVLSRAGTGMGLVLYDAQRFSCLINHIDLIEGNTKDNMYQLAGI